MVLKIFSLHNHCKLINCCSKHVDFLAGDLRIKSETKPIEQLDHGDDDKGNNSNHDVKDSKRIVEPAAVKEIEHEEDDDDDDDKYVLISLSDSDDEEIEDDLVLANKINNEQTIRTNEAIYASSYRPCKVHSVDITKCICPPIKMPVCPQPSSNTPFQQSRPAPIYPPPNSFNHNQHAQHQATPYYSNAMHPPGSIAPQQLAYYAHIPPPILPPHLQANYSHHHHLPPSIPPPPVLAPYHLPPFKQQQQQQHASYAQPQKFYSQYAPAQHVKTRPAHAPTAPFTSASLAPEQLQVASDPSIFMPTEHSSKLCLFQYIDMYLPR